MQLYSCRRLFALSCLKVTQASTAPCSDSLFQLLLCLAIRSSIVNDLWPVITYQCCQWNFWTVFCRNISPEEIPTTSNCFGGLNSELCFVIEGVLWEASWSGSFLWQTIVAHKHSFTFTDCKHSFTFTDCKHTFTHREIADIFPSNAVINSFLIFCRAESSLSLFLARRRHRAQSSLRCDASSSILLFCTPNILLFCAQIPQKNMNYKKCVKLEIPQKRRTKKFYLALLRGHVEEDRVDIDIPIGERPK